MYLTKHKTATFLFGQLTGLKLYDIKWSFFHKFKSIRRKDKSKAPRKSTIVPHWSRASWNWSYSPQRLVLGSRLTKMLVTTQTGSSSFSCCILWPKNSAALAGNAKIRVAFRWEYKAIFLRFSQHLKVLMNLSVFQTWKRTQFWNLIQSRRGIWQTKGKCQQFHHLTSRGQGLVHAFDPRGKKWSAQFIATENNAIPTLETEYSWVRGRSPRGHPF